MALELVPGHRPATEGGGVLGGGGFPSSDDFSTLG